MFQVIIRKFDLLYAVELSLPSPPLLFHSVSPSHFETSPFIPTGPPLSHPPPPRYANSGKKISDKSLLAVFIYRRTTIHTVSGEIKISNRKKKKKKNSQKSRASRLNIFKRNKNILPASFVNNSGDDIFQT